MGESWTTSEDSRKQRTQPDCRAQVVFHQPRAEFGGCFTTFYMLELEIDDAGGCPGTIVDFLQPEWANIRFFAGSSPKASIAGTVAEGRRFTATGPSSQALRFELGSSRLWGIGFLPMGWGRFITEDAYDVANIVCDGAEHPAFARFETMSEVLTDITIPPQQQYDFMMDTMSSLMQPNRDEAKIRRVHQALVEGNWLSVGELADDCGMSVRTLERVCKRYFGFTPKLLMRRQRFMRSLSTYMLQHSKGDGLRWTEAMDADYHDQAQFTREFREFMTMLPREYAALEHPILGYFMEARARVWGSAAQTLDSPKHG